MASEDSELGSRFQLEFRHSAHISKWVAGPNVASACDGTPGLEVLNSLELMSMIFKHLKEITLKEMGVAIPQDKPPALPKAWTAPFARLARVNRAFFNGSADVLWENMESVKPFLDLLQKWMDGADDRSQLYTSLPSSAEWDRFKLYSSRAKTLCLHAPGTCSVDKFWLFQVLGSKLRPDSLFPALRKLFLTSADDNALFIALSSAPYLSSIYFNIDPLTSDGSDACASLLGQIMNQPTSQLTTLQLSNPATRSLLHNISKAQSLTQLGLTVGADLDNMDLRRLNQLSLLKKLVIRQSLEQQSDEGDIPGSVDFEAVLLRKSPLTQLQDLTVRSTGTFHLQVALVLSPSTLKSLELEDIRETPNIDRALVPLALAIHAKRNPLLIRVTALSALSGASANLPHNVAARFRADSRFNSNELLVSALVSLRNLTYLRIKEIPFFSVQILTELFNMAQSQPQLRTLILRPAPVTSLEADKLIIPPLSVLEGFSNVKLVTLDAYIDCSNVPPPPCHYQLNHTLRCLKLIQRPRNAAGPLAAPDKQLALAKYIDRLFPQVGTVGDAYVEGSNNWIFWQYVEKLVKFSQEARNQVIQDMGMETSIS
ncbi:hypothetical protein NMY22_g5624 [Coprinellus aureogranulatus]|nr:hypothetical protein NMY22_g5624 [Coprinellus aureogranulatus]